MTCLYQKEDTPKHAEQKDALTGSLIHPTWWSAHIATSLNYLTASAPIADITMADR